MSEHVWTKEQQKEHRKLWIEALRSYKYKQGYGALRRSDDRYCCLGVACEVAMKNGLNINISTYENVYSYDDIIDVLPHNIQDYYGLTTNYGYYEINKTKEERSLTDDNDQYNYDFVEISNIIEKEPKGLIEND